jgi:hypothetical protein
MVGPLLRRLPGISKLSNTSKRMKTVSQTGRILVTIYNKRNLRLRSFEHKGERYERH